MITIGIGGYTMENRIRELRKNRGMNQEALASFIGVSQQTISKIERNTDSLSVDILIRLSDQFNVTTDYLLGLSDEKRNISTERRVRDKLEEYHEFVGEYEKLNEYKKKAVVEIIKALREIQGSEL